MGLYTFAFGYDFASESGECLHTQITVPADSKIEATKRFKAILGDKVSRISWWFVGEKDYE